MRYSTPITRDADRAAAAAALHATTTFRGCRRPFFGDDEAAQRRMKGL